MIHRLESCCDAITEEKSIEIPTRVGTEIESKDLEKSEITTKNPIGTAVWAVLDQITVIKRRCFVNKVIIGKQRAWVGTKREVNRGGGRYGRNSKPKIKRV